MSAGDRQREFEKGDLVKFHRGTHLHWAVYIGKGKGQGHVIHLAAERRKLTDVLFRSDNGCVKIAFLDDVAKGNTARLGNDSHGKRNAFPNEKIVRKAFSRLGEKNYNVLFKNCEHFATWCRYGVEISNQFEFSCLLAPTISVVLGLRRQLPRPVLLVRGYFPVPANTSLTGNIQWRLQLLLTCVLSISIIL